MFCLLRKSIMVETRSSTKKSARPAAVPESRSSAAGARDTASKLASKAPSKAPKFPWGDKATDPRIFGLAIAYCGCVMSYVMTQTQARALSGPAGASGLSLSNEGVRRTVLASVLWVLMQLNAFGLQVFLRLGAKNFSQKALGGAERIVYNSLEHAPAFFVLLWAHCVFVDAGQAGVLGLVYVAHRFMYGILFAWMGQFTFLCETCTQPG